MNHPKSARNAPLFIVWKAYQRRAEVLAPYFDAEILFIPHLFRRKWLRPFDYLYKLFVTIGHILRRRPPYAIVQSPPHYAALPAILTRLPYIVDAHNGVFQSYWHKLPFHNLVMRKARAIVVHNPEIYTMVKDDYPGATMHVISDPLRTIQVEGAVRKPDQILFICSFDADEPLESIVEVIESVPEVTFVITADPVKLPPDLRARFTACKNLRLTGFLSTQAYHDVLCTSTAAIALTTLEATQQSGACEALSSDTPLIASKTSLSTTLFGEWAALVENSGPAIVASIRDLDTSPLDLSGHRTRWNETVQRNVDQLKKEITGL